ncbi:TPA: hypothetical protein ACX6PW_002313 [Photobacterium damselae]
MSAERGKTLGRVASGEWRVASGEWRVASGEWRVASGEWRVASGEKYPPARYAVNQSQHA